MKPFDLKAALEGKPVQRHNGKKVPHIHVLPDWAEDFFPVISKDEDGVTESHTIEGRTNKYYEVHDLDLFMADEEVVEYWNCYEGLRPFTHQTKDAAINEGIMFPNTKPFQGTLRITLVDGKITKAEVI